MADFVKVKVLEDERLMSDAGGELLSGSRCVYLGLLWIEMSYGGLGKASMWHVQYVGVSQLGLAQPVRSYNFTESRIKAKHVSSLVLARNLGR